MRKFAQLRTHEASRRERTTNTAGERSIDEQQSNFLNFHPTVPTGSNNVNTYLVTVPRGTPFYRQSDVALPEQPVVDNAQKGASGGCPSEIFR
jgi:hypothetical protein